MKNLINDKNLNVIASTKTATEKKATTKKATAKKATTKKAAVVKEAVTTFKTVFVSEDYKALSKAKGVFRGYTVAAMVLLNIVKLSAKGATKGASAKRTDLVSIVGNTAATHWVKTGRLAADDKGNVSLTAQGATAINESLAGQAKGGYNTSIATVEAISTLFAKGGVIANPNGLRIDMRTRATITA